MEYRVIFELNAFHSLQGAGPAGLASALVLSQRHGYNVTILEVSERTDVYDPGE